MRRVYGTCTIGPYEREAAAVAFVRVWTIKSSWYTTLTYFIMRYISSTFCFAISVVLKKYVQLVVL